MTCDFLIIHNKNIEYYNNLGRYVVNQCIQINKSKTWKYLENPTLLQELVFL